MPSNRVRLSSAIVLIPAIILLSACNNRDRDVPPEPFPPVHTQPTYASAPPVLTPPPTMSFGAVPEVRVALIKDATTVKVGAPGGGAKIVLNGQPWRKLAPNTAVTVSFAGPSLFLEGQPANASSVRFEAAMPDETLKLNDRDGAATVNVTRINTRAGLLAVAQINMEEYLAGVLAGEVPYDKWHAEALKTQAVVSRTFALFEIKGHANDPYDVESTIMSQVFKPGHKSVPVLIAAVSATRGQVLTANNQLFPAYFHSTCGGQTAPAAGIFSDMGGIRPLTGTFCPYCKQSPSYRWSVTFTKEQIAAKLRASHPTMGKIESITFSDSKGPIGASATELRRATSVSIKHSGGVTNMQGNAFRLALSPRDLKSLLFGQIVDSGESITIGGGGYGHGVGLCQYGSQGMALAGQPYQSILGYYFPGAALTRMY